MIKSSRAITDLTERQLRWRRDVAIPTASSLFVQALFSLSMTFYFHPSSTVYMYIYLEIRASPRTAALIIIPRLGATFVLLSPRSFCLHRARSSLLSCTHVKRYAHEHEIISALSSLLLSYHYIDVRAGTTTDFRNSRIVSEWRASAVHDRSLKYEW